MTNVADILEAAANANTINLIAVCIVICLRLVGGCTNKVIIIIFPRAHVLFFFFTRRRKKKKKCLNADENSHIGDGKNDGTSERGRKGVIERD